MYRTAPAAYRLITELVENLSRNGLTGTLMRRFFNKLAQDESGQDLIEYALVAAIVALSAISVLRSYDNNLKGLFNGVGLALANA
jgi:pilus assembly protein Flp/PilA